ncbi:MAG: hypothetical protein P8Z31_11630, partial [Gammaproteobacteria bacterium]
MHEHTRAWMRLIQTPGLGAKSALELLQPLQTLLDAGLVNLAEGADGLFAEAGAFQLARRSVADGSGTAEMLQQ